MRKLAKLIFLASILPTAVFAQNSGKISVDRKAVEYMVTVAGWFTNEACVILPADKKVIFKKNFDNANKFMTSNSGEQEMKKFNNYISQQIKKNKCDAASTELVNKALQISQNFSQNSPDNNSAGPYLNRSATEMYNLTLAVKIEDKCRFLGKDQSATLLLGYMALAQTVDKDYGANSSTAILAKLAVSDALSRNITCSPSEKDFTKKVTQAVTGK